MPRSRGFNWANRRSNLQKDNLTEKFRYMPFDPTFAQPAFPKVKMSPSETSNLVQANDDLLEKLLNDRIQTLTPTEEMQSNLNILVKMIENVLADLKNYTGEESDMVKVVSYQVVGTYKRGTIIAGENMAEIVTYLKILPTATNVEKFSNCIIKCLLSDPADETQSKEETKLDPKSFELRMDEKGFVIVHPTASVKIIMTASTNVINGGTAADMSELSVSEPIFKSAWYLGPQSEWLEKNATDDVLKKLSLIFQDFSRRFSGFKPLTPWIIDILTFYLVKHNPTDQDLTLTQAFRRFFQLLSAGVFLPESTTVLDPCHPMKKPIHFMMTPKEQDELTTTAQTLLRIICHGGYSSVIGAEGNDSLINGCSTWDYGKLGSVVVTPPEGVYQVTE